VIAEPQELSSGSHMFLFAIRLPQVNYPPSMHDSHFGHRIEYTLHGVFDLVSTSHPTEKIPILYLPLVTCNPTTYETSKKTQMFQKEDKKIEVSAELIKPAYCPGIMQITMDKISFLTKKKTHLGDLCTVKMTTSNNSNTKITGVQVSLVALATTLAPTVSSDYVHKQHTLLSEYFYVSIPKNARDHHDIFRFDIPSTIVPTFTNKLGKYMDIAYQVNIDIPNLIPNNTGGIFGGGSGSMGNASTISLPITIATVPPSYPIQVTVHESTDELPTFIPNIESPLPSPVHYPADRAYSVSPSNSFQMRDIDFDLEVEDFALNSHTQDASGLLMVPDNTTRRRSSSEFSDASTLGANSMNRLETVS
jgi:hypothetical protein